MELKDVVLLGEESSSHPIHPVARLTSPPIVSGTTWHAYWIPSTTDSLSYTSSFPAGFVHVG